VLAYIVPMPTPRRILQWLAWGALGPILLLTSYIPLERGWHFYRFYPWVFTRPAVAAEAVIGLVVAAVGVLFIFRPLNWLWAPVVVAATGALDVATDIALYGSGRDEVRLVLYWALIVALTGAYAYHCHVPGYTLSVISGGRFGSTADHRRPAIANWSRRQESNP
jgi:hypothetical protein